MTKVLVTGSSGFIGQHLVPDLEYTGHEVFAANSGHGNICESATWSQFPSMDVVIHMAARTFVPDSWTSPVAFMDTNLQGTMQALEYCRRSQARMVFMSSYLYGNPRVLPTPETEPLKTPNPYALSKKLAEDACEFYAGSFGIPVTILRPFNVYGPGQGETFLVPTVLRQILDGDRVEVLDLLPKRDYVYVADVVSAATKSVDRKDGFCVLNVGSGASHSVGELVDTIQSLLQTKIPVLSTGQRRDGEIMDTVADISQAKALLHWEPRYTLQSGIRQLLKQRGILH